MPSGGRRPGAGRKPTAEKYAPKINAAEKKIADRLPGLVDNLLELANGVTVQEIGFDGEPRTFTRPPCFKSNAYLIDRIIGKPINKVEHTGEGGGPIAIEQDFERLRELPADELMRLHSQALGLSEEDRTG